MNLGDPISEVRDIWATFDRLLRNDMSKFLFNFFSINIIIKE